MSGKNDHNALWH